MVDMARDRHGDPLWAATFAILSTWFAFTRQPSSPAHRKVSHRMNASAGLISRRAPQAITSGGSTSHSELAPMNFTPTW